MRRSSTILVLLALGVSLSACEGVDFDAGDVRDIIETLQDLEAESGGDGTGIGGSGTSGGSGGSGSSGNPGANTDSPNRPPVPDGGVQDGSQSNEGFGDNEGFSEENWQYSPIDRSHDDVVDHYEDYFGSGGRSTTNTEGEPMTIWETPEQQVIVTDKGFSTRVTTRYND